MSTSQPSISRSFERGFSTFGDNLGIILLNTLWYFLLVFGLFITVIGILAIPGITGGYFQMMIRHLRHEKVESGDFIARGFHRGWSQLGVHILFFIGTMIGFVLLIIPGIYLMVRWHFCIETLMDHEKCGVFESLGKSADCVRGRWWSVFGLMIVLGLLAVLVSMTFIGIFVMMPVATLIICQYYLDACANHKS